MLQPFSAGRRHVPRSVCRRSGLPESARALVMGRTLLMLVLVGTAGAAQGDVFKGTPLAGARVTMVGRSLALGLIVGSATTMDGSVLLVDKSVSRVFRITAQGDLAVTYGRAGDGPGEFRLPYRVTELSDGSVLVFDLANQRFSEFSRDGRFVKRWATSADIVSLTDIVSLGARSFAISGIVRDPRAGAHAVHIFDSTFRLIRSFGDLPSARSAIALETIGSGGLRRTPSGELLYSRRFPYELHWYDETGTQRRKATVNKPVLATADGMLAVTSSGMTVTTRFRRDIAYAGFGTPLPDRRIISGRQDGLVAYWDILDDTGRVLWSGRRPSQVSGYIGPGSIGGDRTKQFLWFSGQTGSGEPVLYRITLAEH